jgi:hypothetical protein
VSIPLGLYQEFSAFAEAQGMSLSALLREATDLQMRSVQLKSRDVSEELKELRFLLANIANNVNQIARHSNRIKQVLDENAVLQQIQSLEQTVEDFVDTRVNPPP